MDLARINRFIRSNARTDSIPVLTPKDFGAEEWEIAEKRVDWMLSVIQPTANSERRRKRIIEYVQILMGAAYGIKVSPLGSVPLKTYLTDGDIDLSVISHYDEEVLSSIICNVLQNEAKMNTQIKVTEVQCVPAQVKVVKCFIDYIPVDFTFKQIEGLCALSFLEQVDQLIGNNHLFKRSVILVKAWFFYEGRLLGANYGLISTYALETMVAHIMNFFHSSSNTPLTVLHKFLTYFSNFDWENQCVAIDGVVPVSSLPEVVAQPPDGSDEMLLSAEFLQTCRERCSVSTGINQTDGTGFVVKFVNVVDPLRNNNNIGRSVNRASYHRIKYAIIYAANMLNCVFALPKELISKGIETYYKTTLARYGFMPAQNNRNPEASRTLDHNANEDILAGIEYGLWCHDFGVYRDRSTPMVVPDMWNRFNHLGLGGRYDLNTLFRANDSARLTGEPSQATKSRGTGTYIPNPVYMVTNNVEEDYVGDDGSLVSLADLEEEGEDTKMNEAEDPGTPPELGDMSEFPPLQGKP